MTPSYRPLAWSEDSPRAEALPLPQTEELPAGEVHWRLNSLLRDYQREGVRFLWDRLGRGAGGILCDDMGLGKTVQVISLLSAVYNKAGDREDQQNIRALKRDERSVVPALIICPGSVLSNWEEELDKWAHFYHRKYHGQDRKDTLTQVRLGRVELVLTTFETARDHLEELDRVTWQMVVVDECHKIKEKNSGTTKALKSLSCLKRVGLTGTALQNKYEELWCLLDWANPGCLGSLEHFKAEFSLPMVRGFRQDATSNELSEARKKQEEFNAQKQHWLIRRTKASVIGDQLPTKSDQVIFCGLSTFQREVFRFLLDLPEVRAVFSSLELCPCGKKRPRHKCCQRSETDSPRAMLLQMIPVFLKAANHAALLLPHNTASAAQAELGDQICRGCVRKFPELEESNFLNLSNPRYSGKMEVLASLLNVLEQERSKVLLFSYSTTLLTILETFIQSKGYSYCRLDGNTRVGARQEMVNTFNRDKGTFIFLLSTKAGGLGLNITGANTVIIFDPNWNPSHDMQAQDRAYRLGQTRDVKVFRLISAGCIEEIVYLRQLYKQQLAANSIEGCSAKRLFRAVQGDKKRKGELFGIKNLFKVTPGHGSCLTEDIERRHSDIEKKILRRSKVSLSVQDFELNFPIEEDRNASKDPFQIGLEDDLEDGLSGGVVYSHSNDLMVGGSKEEQIISKLAIRSAGTSEGSKVANEIDCEDVDPEEESEELIQTDKYNPGETADLTRTVETPDRRIVYGKTPASKRRQFFAEIAEVMKLDQTELARRVTEMSWLEKLEMIRKLHSSDAESVGLLDSCSEQYKEQWRVQKLRDISYSKAGPSSSGSVRTRVVSKTPIPPAPLPSVITHQDQKNHDSKLLLGKPPLKKRLITSEDGDDKKSGDPSSSTSTSEDEKPHRPLKPAPEGIYFKRRRKIPDNSTDEEAKWRTKEYDSSQMNIDELFPDPKLKILNSKRERKDVHKKRDYKIIDETLDDIFG